MIVVGLSVLDQGGRHANFAVKELSSLGGERWIGRGYFFSKSCGGLAIHVPSRAGGGFAKLDSQVAHLGNWVREQAGDLGFESAGADNLAKRSIGCQREQIAGHVEGACLQGPLIGFGLERLGAGDAAAQQFKNSRGGALVGGEEILHRVGVKLGRARILQQNQEDTSQI